MNDRLEQIAERLRVPDMTFADVLRQMETEGWRFHPPGGVARKKPPIRIFVIEGEVKEIPIFNCEGTEPVE